MCQLLTSVISIVCCFSHSFKNSHDSFAQRDYERQTGAVWPVACADAKSARVMKCEGYIFHLKRKINEKLCRISQAF